MSVANIPAGPASGGLRDGYRQPTCPIESLSSVQTFAARLHAGEAGRREADRTAEARLSFARAVRAVLGPDAVGNPEYSPANLLAAADGRVEIQAVCDQPTGARDRTAYRLAMVGYNEAEITEILLGHVTRAELDARQALMMTGLSESPARVASAAAQTGERWSPAAGGTAFAVAVSAAPADAARSVDPRRWTPVTAEPAEASAVSSGAAAPLISPVLLDAYIRRYAAAYQIDYLLIAAMIRHESNWHSSVVSSKGAIGLMQLMPETAAMLGVNPNDPLDNVRGGIAYMAGLLRTYKDVRLALIAYNAGPEHANKVVRGEIGVYPETRRYLDTINAIYTLPGTRQP
jgi:soluble lytic murein transglycosylase-like protein